MIDVRNITTKLSDSLLLNTHTHTPSDPQNEALQLRAYSDPNVKRFPEKWEAVKLLLETQ